jgi:Tol biopolymer transport system component
MILLGLAFMAGLLVAGALRRAPGKREVTRFSVAPPAGGTFGPSPSAPVPTVSPNGRLLAFLASAGDSRNQLWVRSLDSVSARALPGTQSAASPFWSPDSRHLGFVAEGKLKKIDISGGPPQPLADAEDGGSWNEEGIILFGRDDGLNRVSSQGGETTRVSFARRPSSRRLSIRTARSSSAIPGRSRKG